MSNVLGDDKRHQIVALGRLGWSGTDGGQPS
jgi:hypothetical protein